MDYSYIFSSAKPLKEKFADFGLKKREGSYVCKKTIAGGDFYALLEIRGQALTAQVYDAATDELYASFDMRGARGSFVAAVREEVQKSLTTFARAALSQKTSAKNTLTLSSANLTARRTFRGRNKKARPSAIRTRRFFAAQTKSGSRL